MQIIPLADRPDAVERLARWYYDTWGRAAGKTLEQEVERVAGFANRDAPPQAVVAVDGDEVVGSAVWKIREMDRYPEYEHWLGSVFVDPGHRGRGVAGSLVREVVRRTDAAGVERLYLQTEDLSGGLYARLGFEPLHEVESHGARVLVMVRRATR